ncbi:MAG: prolipoprotein diacylglyceryl transferase, partial [Candidatus Sericytochromatia bacterium]|nr:prolipoprotein diacylglyceryl transferase [Candidatus Sericytochromatia bacterium]
MIPYFELGKLFTIPFINKDVQSFGVLVAIGIIIAYNLGQWKAKQNGLDQEKFSSLVTFMLITGFIFAHIFDHLFYHFDELVKNPFSILYFWSGLSSFGGFFGSYMGILYYCKKHKLNMYAYADVICFALPVGYIFGRAGCAVVHDHIGARTNFFLGINFPDTVHGQYIANLAGTRHDLGFYEMLLAIFISSIFLILRNKKNVPNGYYVSLLCLIYAPVRFYFDSLRATDLSGA